MISERYVHAFLDEKENADLKIPIRDSESFYSPVYVTISLINSILNTRVDTWPLLFY